MAAAAPQATIEVFFGLSGHNLTIFCWPYAFRVHRDVVSQASEVWNRMMCGGFAEAFAQEISLPADDPEALHLVLDIVYAQLCGQAHPAALRIGARACVADAEQVQAVVDKYQLTGVMAFVVTSSELMALRVANADRLRSESVQGAAPEGHTHRIARLREVVPGSLVRLQDHPPVGARVKLTMGEQYGLRSDLRGTILFVEVQAIVVVWDDGSESHSSFEPPYELLFI